MKFALPLLSCLVLASCAPALIPGVDGRIVNVKSGQEGVITFLGGFRDRAVSTGSSDNVTVSLGDLLYSGKYTVLGHDGPRLGVGLGFGYGNIGYGGFPNLGGDSLFGPTPYYDGDFYGSFRPYDQSPARPGNLIARATAADGSVSTLSCSFQTDRGLHGVGTCQDSAGAAYTLQF